MRQSEWTSVAESRKQKEEEERASRKALLEANALMNKFSEDMDSLSENLSEAVGNDSSFVNRNDTES